MHVVVHEWMYKGRVKKKNDKGMFVCFPVCKNKYVRFFYRELNGCMKQNYTGTFLLMRLLLHFPFDYLFYKPKNYCSIFLKENIMENFWEESRVNEFFSVWFLDTFRKRGRSVYHFDYPFLCKDCFLYIFFLFDSSFWILFFLLYIKIHEQAWKMFIRNCCNEV